MFLIEVSMLNIKNYMFCKDFDIKAKFADQFKLTLRKPTRRRRKRVRESKEENKENIDYDIEDLSQTEYLEMKLKTGEAVLLPSNVLKLSMLMKTCPLEVTLWRRSPPFPLGSTKIKWNQIFWSYLNYAYGGKRASPVTVIENVDLYNDTTYKLVASARLKIKLSYLRYRPMMSLPLHAMSEERKGYDDVTACKTTLEPLAVSPTFRQIQESFQEAMDNVPPDQMFLLLPEVKQPYIVEEVDEVPKEKECSNDNRTSLLSMGVMSSGASTKSSYTTISEYNRELNRLTILSLTKSETKLTDDFKKVLDITRSRSISAFDIFDRYNPHDYIFLNKNQSFADQQYTVGYMALMNKGKNNMTKLEKQKETCSCKSAKPCTCADNISKIADPCVVECKGLTCEQDMLPPPDDRVLLGLAQPCCEVQELHGEMKASIRGGIGPGEKPCECTCPCTFDFIKKTDYCKICGGYQTAKGDLDDTTVHPCPMFHQEVPDKKVDANISKKKKKTGSGGDDDKYRDLDEARFKFNYGYQGIRMYCFFLLFFIILHFSALGLSTE